MDRIDRWLKAVELLQQQVEAAERVLETASFPVGSMAAKERLEEATREAKEFLENEC